MFFNEDESLGGLVTSISLVILERIYVTANLLKQGKVKFYEGELEATTFYSNGKTNAHLVIKVDPEAKELISKIDISFTDFEQSLITKMNSYRLATV